MNSPDHGPTLVLSFGEIDIRVHVHAQSKNNEIPADLVVSELVLSAIRGVRELQKISNCRIVFLAPPPPTDIACNPQFPTCGNLDSRIQWTRQFSIELQKAIVSKEILHLVVVDVSAIFAGHDGSLPFENSDGNVHYSKAVGKHIIQLIKDLG